MKRKFTVALLLLSSFSLAHAQDEAAKRAKVEKLLTSMHVDRMSDQVMAAAKAQADQTLHSGAGASMTAEQKKITAEFQDHLLKLVSDAVGWKSLEPQFIELYIKNFSDAEIDAMVSFYGSPEGQSVIAKMPQLLSQSIAISQQRMTELQPKIKALSDDYAKQMAAAQGDKKS